MACSRVAQLFEFGEHLKELLDLARRLVGIEDLGRAANRRAPVSSATGLDCQ